MEDNKVNVRLEKHLWPDEIKSKRKKRSIVFLVILGLLFSFAFGLAVGKINQRASTYPNIVDDGDDDVVVTEPLTLDQQFSKFQYIYEVLSHNWYFSRDMENPTDEIMTNAIMGMIENNGDIHTDYLSPEELRDFEQGINMDFVGIGVQYYQVDGYSIILKVFNDSPAEKAGVKPGDIFITVDGIDVVNMDTSSISDLVKGEENTDVTIVFNRNEELIEKVITRAAISSTTYAEMLEGNIGYLEINSFGLSTGKEVQKELITLISQGMTKLVIDLRDNGGGYLSSLNEIASYFLEKDQIIIAQEDVNGDISYTYADGKKIKGIEDIVVLVNQNSASASEVLALSLRDNLNTPLIGTKTYGKGTVQTTIPLADGSALKYTIAQWLSPHGDRIHQEGIEPTIEVKIHEVFHTTSASLKANETVGVDEVNEAIIYVQEALDFLGFNPGRFDGYFSEDTLKAYQEYLDAYDSDQSDVVTRESMTQLSSRVYQKYYLETKELDTQLEKAIELLR